MYGLNILRGELLLDREYPEWLSAIDTDSLNLNDTAACVLGQVELHANPEGGQHSFLYLHALDRLGLTPDAGDENPASPHYNGFDACAPSHIFRARSRATDDYARLTREWLAAIADRREPASPDPVAYAYDAALHHADCVLVRLGALTREENAARRFPVEHALDRLAEDYGVQRAGEFDLNDFPVPITDDAALITGDGRPESCDTCLQVIEP